MRAVIQRVSEAKVSIAGIVKGAIQNGLAVLLAVEEPDTAEDIEWLSGKIVRLRVFDDEAGLMNRSVQETQLSARRLDPTGVMQAGDGGMLRPQLGMRIPARVEEDKNRTDVVPRRDCKKRINSLSKALRVLLP